MIKGFNRMHAGSWSLLLNLPEMHPDRNSLIYKISNIDPDSFLSLQWIDSGPEFLVDGCPQFSYTALKSWIASPCMNTVNHVHIETGRESLAGLLSKMMGSFLGEDPQQVYTGLLWTRLLLVCVPLPLLLLFLWVLSWDKPKVFWMQPLSWSWMWMGYAAWWPVAMWTPTRFPPSFGHKERRRQHSSRWKVLLK